MRPARRAALVSGAAVMTLLIAGCGSPGSGGHRSAGVPGAGPSTTTSSSTPTPPPGPVVTTNASSSMAAGKPLTVSVSTGKLTTVEVTGQAGNLPGTLSADGRRWTSTAERAPISSYRISATATGDNGSTTEFRRTFSTGAPPRTLSADVTPWGGQSVGVGQPLVVQLSAPVHGKEYRAAVESALVVSASRSIGPASWHWMSDTELHYRPQNFWPGHTNVTVHVNLARVHGGSGLWGVKDRDVTFVIGRAFVMRISNATHQMTVSVDGRTVRTIPVSMGRPGYETRSGIKTIMSHDRSVRMTSASYGGKDFYDEVVYYAQRMTWSGEYIHSAPWSVGAQGHTNVSHGCVNVSPDNAIWLFGQTQIGDPVITTGTGRQMEPGNGTGGDWDISWSSWLAGSALSH